MTNTNELARRLTTVPLFSRCSNGELRSVARHCETVTVAAGQPIVRQGDNGDAFFMLLSGSAVVARDGIEVNRLSAGEWFGELALLDPAPRSATVVALDDTELAILARRMFAVVLREMPTVSASLLGALAGRLRTASTPSSLA